MVNSRRNRTWLEACRGAVAALAGSLEPDSRFAAHLTRRISLGTTLAVRLLALFLCVTVLLAFDHGKMASAQVLEIGSRGFAASLNSPSLAPSGDVIAGQDGYVEHVDDDLPGAVNSPWAGHPNSEWRSDYYRDSESNRVFTLTYQDNILIHKVRFTLFRDWVEARDSAGAARSMAAAVAAYGNLSESWGAGGGLGLVQTWDGWSTFIGSARTSVNVGDLSIEASASRSLLVGGAQTIRTHAMQEDLGLTIWHDLSDNLGYDFEYHRGFFSDGNSSNEVEFSPEYGIEVRKWARLSFGYDFDYVDFAKPSDQVTLGYWGPNGQVSNNGVIKWKLKLGDNYGVFKLGLGRSFHINTSAWSQGVSGSAVVAVGRELPGGMRLESYFRAGRSALGIPAAWNSINTGFTLSYPF